MALLAQSGPLIAPALEVLSDQIGRNQMETDLAIALQCKDIENE